eukprot:sb/3474986/
MIKIHFFDRNEHCHSFQDKHFPVQNLTNYVWLSISFPMRPRTVKLDNHKRHSVMFLEVSQVISHDQSASSYPSLAAVIRDSLPLTPIRNGNTEHSAIRRRSHDLTNFKKHDTVSLVVVQFNCSRSHWKANR